MWEVRNRTPYRTFGRLVVDKQGRKHWLVTIRGTFDVAADGATTPSKEQLDPVVAPEYRGEDGASSLLFDSDTEGEKVNIDVVVEGSAHAPAGKAATLVNVALETPFFRKILSVLGDCVWTRNMAGIVVPGDPLPFSTKPVIYERAYGGFDDASNDPAQQRLCDENPVGVGCVRDTDSLIGSLAPNVLFPGESPATERVAGFGPIAGHWAPRTRFVGTYDAKWVEDRKPLLPKDFDPRFFNAAPPDQQIDKPYLGGGQFRVVNMSPNGTFAVQIPRLVFGLETHFGRVVRHHRATLKAVILEPAEARVALVWQGRLECHALFDDLDYTNVDEKTVAN